MRDSRGGSKFAVTDGATGGQAYEDRLIAIHAMRADGLTLQAIGDVFGLTRERVRQLLVMSNGPTSEQVREFRRLQHEAEVELAQRRLVDWLREHPGSTMQEARASLAWTEAQLATAITREAYRYAVQSRDGEAHRQYSDEETFAALRQAWRLTQSRADGLSLNRYQELLDAEAITGPSAVRIVQIFGSWSRAADLAGIPSGRTPNRNYSSHWSDGEILAFVVRYLQTPGTTGTFSGWDPWRREHEPDAPSSALLRLRLGKWSGIKALALASASSEPGSA